GLKPARSAGQVFGRRRPCSRTAAVHAPRAASQCRSRRSSAGLSTVSSSPFRTRIKFCGMTRPDDVRLACALGVDAVGFVFARRSRRRREPGGAGALRAAVAPLVDAVALFMDNSADEVRAAVAALQPSLLQFHGDEEDAFCRSFGLPYM